MLPGSGRSNVVLGVGVGLSGENGGAVGEVSIVETGVGVGVGRSAATRGPARARVMSTSAAAIASSAARIWIPLPRVSTFERTAVVDVTVDQQRSVCRSMSDRCGTLVVVL
jgi:hypothetical protein